MKLLTDAEIKQRIDNLTLPLITKLSATTRMSTVDWQSKDSQIQSCSVDLHIGRIQIPSETERERIQEFSNIGDEHWLEIGQTAVLTTIEALHMPSNVAGIGFPPSKVSIQGLLMTNPGHVDPGYEGPLHFTVINMGRHAYRLRIDEPICTLLFFELDSEVHADYLLRHGLSRGTPSPNDRPTGLREGEVNRLTKDFVDVEKRAKRISKDTVIKAGFAGGVLAVLVSAVTAAASQFVPYYLGNTEELKRNLAVEAKEVEYLKERVTELEKKESTGPALTPQTLNRQDAVSPVRK